LNGILQLFLSLSVVIFNFKAPGHFFLDIYQVIVF